MQVLLLATGENEHLAPLTTKRPSPMVAVVDRPVMAIAIENLVRAGIKRVLVSLYNQGSSVVSYFGDGRRWGIKIEYLPQNQLWGSAGILKWIARRLQESVLVLPADAIIDLDASMAMKAHHAGGSGMTLVLHQPQHKHEERLVNLDARNKICAIGEETSTDTTLANFTGAFILDPGMLEYIPANTEYNVYEDLLPQLLSSGVEVTGYMMPGYWNALDTFNDYQSAQVTYLRSAPAQSDNSDEQASDIKLLRYTSMNQARQIAPGVWVGANSYIHPDARIASPIYIGSNCSIGGNVELGPEAVIGSGVIIDNGATVQYSTILEHTYVGQFVNVDSRIVEQTMIIDPATSSTTNTVDPFLLSETTRTETTRQAWLSVLVAAFLLFLSLPLTIPISLLLFVAARGQVFSRTPHIHSRRIGQPPSATHTNPESFDLLRFSTQRRDGSLSRLGSWLCKREIDRIPTLWNVVRGDIGLVGVKPLTLEEAANLTDDWQLRRYTCPAGFTGLWYTQADADSNLETILITDAYYAATRSWLEDLRILIRTPMVWLRRTRSSQASDYQLSSSKEQVDEVHIA